MKYADQLKSPKWQKKRLDILSLRGFKCEKCKSEDEQLHVHHRFYITGRKAWEYDNDVFQVLCHICHEKEHSKKEIVQKYPQIVEFIDGLKEGDKFEYQKEKFLKIISYLMDNTDGIEDISFMITLVESTRSDFNLSDVANLVCNLVDKPFNRFLWLLNSCADRGEFMIIHHKMEELETISNMNDFLLKNR